MSPKKITDTDKLEIAQLYRQAGETTASLASRYGVSNSTISRILKTTIPEAEYEELIQQKRGLKVIIDDEIMTVTEESSPLDRFRSTIDVEPGEIETQLSLKIVENDVEKLPDLEPTHGVASPVSASTTAMETPLITEDLGTNTRRVRRRSSAPEGDFSQPIDAVIAPPAQSADLAEGVDSPSYAQPATPPTTERLAVTGNNLDLQSAAVVETATLERGSVAPPVPRIPVLRNARAKQDDYFADEILATPVERVAEDEEDEDEDVNAEDVSVLAAMFGEEIADGDDEEFGDEEEDDDDDDTSSADRQTDRDRLLTIGRLQVIPLAQATLPRTCYIVIDKFAELIVRPLKDFAELGQIPGEEIQQRTLPIFDNHRVAKRFSNQRTQRVIKVPDSKVFYKTSQHLRSKGITRLLVDGNIYSLN
jgi:transposase-like protein